MLRCLLTSPWVIALLFALTGCAAAGTPYRQFEIQVGAEAEPRLPKNPDETELLGAITGVMSQRLGLALPAGTTAYVFVNQATFVEGIVRIAGSASETAWEQGSFATAVASGSAIFLRGDRLATMSLSHRAGLLAHELAHISQRHLGTGGRSGAAIWIREGHAEWVRFRVLDALGFVPYDESRAEVVRSVRQSPTPLRFFPDLGSIARNRDWIEARNRVGSAATYGQAFLAVEWLVERYGHDKLVEFLRTFGSGSAGGHWQAVYQIPHRQFIEEFRARLEALR